MKNEFGLQKQFQTQEKEFLGKKFLIKMEKQK